MDIKSSRGVCANNVIVTSLADANANVVVSLRDGGRGERRHAGTLVRGSGDAVAVCWENFGIKHTLELDLSKCKIESVTDSHLCDALIIVWVSSLTENLYDPSEDERHEQCEQAGHGKQAEQTGSDKLSDKMLSCGCVPGHVRCDRAQQLWEICNRAYLDWRRSKRTEDWWVYLGKIDLLGEHLEGG